MERGRIIEVKIQVVVNFLTKCKLRDFVYILWNKILGHKCIIYIEVLEIDMSLYFHSINFIGYK